MSPEWGGVFHWLGSPTPTVSMWASKTRTFVPSPLRGPTRPSRLPEPVGVDFLHPRLLAHLGEELDTVLLGAAEAGNLDHLRKVFCRVVAVLPRLR